MSDGDRGEVWSRRRMRISSWVLPFPDTYTYIHQLCTHMFLETRQETTFELIRKEFTFMREPFTWNQSKYSTYRGGRQ